MKRRTFLKSTMGAGAGIALPALTMQSLLNPAHAVPAYNELNFTAPAVLPQVMQSGTISTAFTMRAQVTMRAIG